MGVEAVGILLTFLTGAWIGGRVLNFPQKIDSPANSAFRMRKFPLICTVAPGPVVAAYNWTGWNLGGSSR